MTDPLSTYPCPVCGATASLDGPCPGCGRAPDPQAAEVRRLDAELAAMHAHVEELRRPFAEAAARFEGVKARRNAVAAQVRARANLEIRSGQPSPVRPQPASPVPASAVPASPVPAGTAPRPETSPRTVQNVLFILGGLLLGAAAIVFTIVAWATFGVTGRSVILASLTLAALAVPPVALRFALRSTAETFAALGLLLVLLDGYAAWYVNLGGLADGTAPTTYAGLVFAVTAVVGLGYGWGTGLFGPRFAGLVVAQPVLPLLAAEWDTGESGWSVLFSLIAAIDLLVVWLLVRDHTASRSAPRIAGVAIAGTCGGLTLFAALLTAMYEGARVEGLPAQSRASGALVLVAVIVLLAGLVARHPVAVAVGAGAGTALVSVAAGRLGGAAVPEARFVAWGAAVAAVGVLVLAVPSRWRTGPWIGSSLVAGVVGLVAAGQSVVGGLASAAAAQPAWHADLGGSDAPYDWQLPVVVALVTVALAVPAWRWSVEIATAGAALAALAVPEAYSLLWWTPSMVDAFVAVPAAVVAALSTSRVRAVVCGSIAGALAVHAGLAGLARPVTTVVAFGGIAVLAALVAFLARRSPAAVPVGAGATVLGLLALPVVAAAAGELLPGRSPVDGVPLPLGAAAVGLAAALVVTALLAGRWPEYAIPGIAAIGLGGLGVVVASMVVDGAPFGVFAALAVLADLIAVVAVVGNGWDVRRGAAVTWSAVLGGPAVLAALVAVTPAVARVLVMPYAWVGSIWSGRPSGTGLNPYGSRTWDAGSPFADGPAAIALALVALGLAAVGAGVARPHGPLWTAVRYAAPAAALAVLTGCAALRAPWPTIAVTSLAVAVLTGLVAAAVPVGRPPVDLTATTVALGGAGIAGTLATRPSTLGALGAVVVAGAVAGTVGKTLVARTTAWLVSVAGGAWLAVAAATAAGVGLRWAAYWVLAAAALALALSVLIRRRDTESLAVEVAAHATAVVALLLTAGSIRLAAGICTLWGVAVGLRALVAASGRRLRIVAATGAQLVAYWLLIASMEVALVEAYTIPAAAVALLAGWLAARGRPELRSWTAFGPALVAGFGPSLVSALADGDPVRRLCVGAAAVVVVIAGSAGRLQAPVVAGGTVLGITALHEITRTWDLLPTWAPLAVAGLLLVLIATTYERRRRDLARLRGAVARMR